MSPSVIASVAINEQRIPMRSSMFDCFGQALAMTLGILPPVIASIAKQSNMLRNQTWLTAALALLARNDDDRDSIEFLKHRFGVSTNKKQRLARIIAPAVALFTRARGLNHIKEASMSRKRLVKRPVRRLYLKIKLFWLKFEILIKR